MATRAAWLRPLREPPRDRPGRHPGRQRRIHRPRVGGVRRPHGRFAGRVRADPGRGAGGADRPGGQPQAGGGKAPTGRTAPHGAGEGPGHPAGQRPRHSEQRPHRHQRQRAVCHGLRRTAPRRPPAAQEPGAAPAGLPARARRNADGERLHRQHHAAARPPPAFCRQPGAVSPAGPHRGPRAHRRGHALVPGVCRRLWRRAARGRQRR